jgi:hypothetical protein
VVVVTSVELVDDVVAMGGSVALPELEDPHPTPTSGAAANATASAYTRFIAGMVEARLRKRTHPRLRLTSCR